jgi:Na+-transporting NADH:ubiquinone oxidoreductase subunit F
MQDGMPPSTSSFKIVVNGDRTIEAQAGGSLFAALNANKIFLPSICGGRGKCGRCRCRVISGGGELTVAENALLSPQDIAGGVRLACQVTLSGDLAVEISEHLLHVQEYEAEVELIKDLTYDIKLVRFALIDPSEIIFKPGQYIQLSSKPYGHVQDVVSRSYSIASPADETDRIDLMVRRVPEGICSNWIHCHVQTGERIRFVGPGGDFYLREGTGDILLVAGASGMAPMVPILNELAKVKTGRRVTYFFGAQSRRDLFYLDEMEAFRRLIPTFEFVPCLSDPQPGDDWNGKTGLITAPLEAHLAFIDTREAQAYLCGSPGMIHACRKLLAAHGVDHDRIFYDPFT